jgi:hypothetical protein
MKKVQLIVLMIVCLLVLLKPVLADDETKWYYILSISGGIAGVVRALPGWKGVTIVSISSATQGITQTSQMDPLNPIPAGE